MLGDFCEITCFELIGAPRDPAHPPGQRPAERNLTRLCSLLQSDRRPWALLAEGASSALALRAAALCSEEIRGIAIVSPQFCCRYPRLAALASHNRLLFWFYWTLANPGDRAWHQLARYRPAQSGKTWPWLMAYIGELHGASNPPYVAGVRSPALLIAGDLDPLRSAASCEQLNASLPSSHLLRTAHGGRWPQREDPQLMRSALSPFLLQVTREAWPAVLRRRWREFWRSFRGVSPPRGA